MDDIIEKIEVWFTYHKPDEEQIEQYNRLRDAAKVFALAIADNAPNCADRTAAFRKVREAVMEANAAIACRGV
ncbi:MAG: hypothetical protein WC655_16690 [Candidatus Hydrogenedentales bacterium]|jgi:hypothetical protein